MATDPISENSGFRMFDIWDLGALQFLSLIAKASADSQTAWGDNTGPVNAAPKTGDTNAKIITKGTTAAPTVWLDDMWKCYGYYIDKLKFQDKAITLASPDTNTPVSFGTAAASSYTPPTSSGWVRDILDCPITLGDDVHDLMEIFIPKTVTATEAQATFADMYEPSLSGAAYPVVGGSASFTTQPGLFYMGMVNGDGTDDITIACRMAKS